MIVYVYCIVVPSYFLFTVAYNNCINTYKKCQTAMSDVFILLFMKVTFLPEEKKINCYIVVTFLLWQLCLIQQPTVKLSNDDKKIVTFTLFRRWYAIFYLQIVKLNWQQTRLRRGEVVINRIKITWQNGDVSVMIELFLANGFPSNQSNQLEYYCLLFTNMFIFLNPL